MIPGLTPLPSDTSTSQLPNAKDKQLGKEDFLKLLVAQLSTQDPLNPLEGQEFTAQLAQFSSLEQMTNINQNLEEIQKFNLAMNNSSAINLIGKKVDAPGKSFDHVSGQTETLSFSLGDDATSVKIDIFDNFGNKVDSVTLNNLQAGNNQAIWNGIDNAGKSLPTGSYTFQVSAEGINANLVEAKTFTSGLVTDVIFEDGKSYAIVNNEKLLVDEISRVSINQ